MMEMGDNEILKNLSFIDVILSQKYTKKERKSVGINRLVLAVWEGDLEKCKKYHHLLVYPQALTYFCKSIPIAAYFISIGKKMHVAYATFEIASFLIKNGFTVPSYSTYLTNAQLAQLHAEASMTKELRRFSVCIIGLKTYKRAFQNVDRNLIKEIARQVWQSRFAMTPKVTSVDRVLVLLPWLELIGITFLGILGIILSHRQ